MKYNKDIRSEVKKLVIRGWLCKRRNSSVVEMCHFEILFEMGKLQSYTRVQHVN